MLESQQMGASAGTIARSGLTLVASGLSSVEASLLPLSYINNLRIAFSKTSMIFSRKKSSQKSGLQ
jgi:hypothetical protein